MIAPDPTLWLRDALRERADVKSAEIMSEDGVEWIALTFANGARAWCVVGTRTPDPLHWADSEVTPYRLIGQLGSP